jgi:methylenetetrahydrofolate dehydrogenase (NADP+)/methenyltetrahydrofolate cyclohydrolase
MDGKALAERIRADVAREVAELGSLGLATILVGDDPASEIYIGHKHKAASEVGIAAQDVRLPAEISEDDLIHRVSVLNHDEEVDGVLVQLPLPPHLDEALVIRTIDAVKDVDGLHPFNAGHLFLGRPTLVGATPTGILELLNRYEIPLEGARAVVVGRSDIVGKPVAHLLLQENATVTICHSRTADLGRETLEADVLVVAVGSPGVVRADMVKPGATVIDVGMNRDESSRKVLGDVDPSAMEEAAYMTPVPGGVGPMTIAMVLQNAVTAARLRRAVPIATPKN